MHFYCIILYFSKPPAPQAKAPRQAVNPLPHQVCLLLERLFPCWPRGGEFQRSSPLEPFLRLLQSGDLGVDTSPSSFKSSILGARLSGAGLKNWGCLMWGSNPWLLWEKLWVLRSLLTNCGSLGQRQDCRSCCIPASPICFDVGKVAQPVFRVLFYFQRTAVPNASVDSLCL